MVGQIDGGDHFFTERTGPTAWSDVDDPKGGVALAATAVEFGYQLGRIGHRTSGRCVTAG